MAGTRSPRETAEEKEMVRRFVVWLIERPGDRTYAEYARRAEVSEYLLAAWRSPTQEGAPSALNLLRLLEASDALSDEAKKALAHAREQAQTEAVPAEGLPRVPRRRAR